MYRGIRGECYEALTIVRVAILHGSNDLYGASRVLLADVEILRALGHDVTVVMPEEGPLTSALESAAAKVVIDNLSVLRRVTATSGTRIPLRLPRACSDCSLVVLWTLALVAYLPVLKAHGYRAMCSVHEILPGAKGRVLALSACFGARVVMVNSAATAQWLSRGTARRPVLAYPAAPAFAPAPRATSDVLRLLLVGRVNGHKGHLEAIHAVELARGEGASVELVLAGGAFRGQEQHLQSVRDAAADRPWVMCAGEVPDARALMVDCDAVLVPTTRPEPFGLVALEAWACGRRIIASNLGGLAEATSMVEGLSVPAGDVQALAECVLRASEDPTLLRAPRADAPVAKLCSRDARVAAWREALADVGA